jgi:homoserine O-succinyltransferase/O-acetyltransferase
MPLIIDGGRVPDRWAERRSAGSVTPIDSRAKGREGITLALINNMPDSALEDTELQFFDLLDAASGDVHVYIRLYSLAGVPRTDRGQRHLNCFYFPFEDLWQNRFDGVIITGTEPHHPNLRDEPYWDLLTQVFDWAERSTSSTILSCLAAHASVLHADGINRYRLPDKRFGVFDSAKKSVHPLTSQIADQMCFPHSRWNEVRADELVTCGYTILTESAEAGVDLFVKKKKENLFVHFQGHPEYGAQTLLKEYRRDIKRFLREERDTYPTVPAGYFNLAVAQILNDFREHALADRREQLIESFPEAPIVGSLQNTWRSSAACVYRNWLQYVIARKAEASPLAVMARVGSGRSAVADGELA